MVDHLGGTIWEVVDHLGRWKWLTPRGRGKWLTPRREEVVDTSAVGKKWLTPRQKEVVDTSAGQFWVFDHDGIAFETDSGSG